jgi:hypothetical protein
MEYISIKTTPETIKSTKTTKLNSNTRLKIAILIISRNSENKSRNQFKFHIRRISR